MKGYFSKVTIPPSGGEGLKHPNAIGRELRGPSRWFDASLFVANDRGEIWVSEGMVLAQVWYAASTGETSYESSYKYVPYSEAGSYGTGSDVAVGILDVTLNLNYNNDTEVSPVIHSQLYESGVYVYGGAKGTVPAAVKTALDGIFWA